MTSPPIRVLLIDDDESDYLMTRALLGQLEGSAPEVEWAASAEDGLRKLVERRHDVCLLDYFLGEETGLDLLRKARAQGIRTPVILLTGKGSRDLDLEAMRTGAVDYLVKGNRDPESMERSLRYAVERHRAQEALRQSEERHRGMFDHLPLGLYRVTEEGEYLEANPALIRALDFPEREALRRNYASNFFVHARDRDRFFRTISEQGVVLGFETELVTANGRRIRVRNTARVQRGPAGSIEYVEGTVEDVTGGGSSGAMEEDALAFRALLERALTGVLRVDGDGRVGEANASALRLLGRDERQLRNEVLWDLFNHADAPAIAGAIDRIGRGSLESITLATRVEREGGQSSPIRLTLAAISGSSIGGEDRILVLVEEPSGVLGSLSGHRA